MNINKYKHYMESAAGMTGSNVPNRPREHRYDKPKNVEGESLISKHFGVNPPPLPKSATQSTAAKTISSNIRIQFNPELIEIFEIIEEEGNYIGFEMAWLADPNSTYQNFLKIEHAKISKSKGCFDVTIGGYTHPMKIENFIKYYWGKQFFVGTMIRDFIEKYDMLVGGVDIPKREQITPPVFRFNPKDTRSTFISLVTKTYPHGHEEEVLDFLPALQKDKVGNYYKIIGDAKPETMFCCHLDTADRIQSGVKLFTYKDENGDEIICTDGITILGADDKTGVTILLYMMVHNIPGIYYFFIGEERGAIGSHALANIYESVDYLSNVKRCVAFDRRDVCSVITRQLGRMCCSDEFGKALCGEFNKSGLKLQNDPTGVFTDSASFLAYIPECTNVSVGYYSEHSGREKQNVTFLEKLCQAALKVNWNSLPTVRRIGISDEIKKKYKDFIIDLKSTPFQIEIKLEPDDYDGKVYITCDLEDGLVDDTYESLVLLQHLLKKHKIPEKLRFSGEYIKIILP